MWDSSDKLYDTNKKRFSVSSSQQQQSKKRMATKASSSPPTGSSSSSMPLTVSLQQPSKKILTEQGPDDWKCSLETILKSSKTNENVWPQVVRLSESLCQSWIRSSLSSPQSFTDRVKSERFSCSRCAGVLHGVVTLSCGHSYCRKCASSNNKSGVSCLKCGLIQPDRPDGSPLKTNVTVGNLVTKWWDDELKAVDLRNQGNDSFANGRLTEAIDKYSSACRSAPGDFTVLSNRSNVLSKLGRFECALKDADEVVRLRPDWPKGHYRRAVALRGLGRHEEALVALLYCAGAERNLNDDICHDTAQELMSLVEGLAKEADPPSRPSSRSSGGSIESSGSEETTLLLSETLLVTKRTTSIDSLVDRLVSQLESFKRREVVVKSRQVDPTKVDESDFECTLCCRLLWQPVTTPCGHSFCRACLDRVMDHSPACPLCKTSLEDYLAERRQCLTEFLEQAMATYLPTAYAERSRLHDEEMRELASSDNIPVFVCTMAYPTVTCPLHVFEPRYRLMIRRCMESGSRQFGMCAYVQDEPMGFAEYGTMLEVRDVEFFADGRSVVDTIGGRRFKVLRRGVLDGYCTARVEYLRDQQPVEPSVVALHDRVRQSALTWVESSAPAQIQARIRQHYGTMPPLEPDWMTLPNGPAWLWWLMAILPIDQRAQVAILSMTKVEKRLLAIQRVLDHVRNRTGR